MCLGLAVQKFGAGAGASSRRCSATSPTWPWRPTRWRARCSARRSAPPREGEDKAALQEAAVRCFAQDALDRIEVSAAPAARRRGRGRHAAHVPGRAASASPSARSSTPSPCAARSPTPPSSEGDRPSARRRAATIRSDGWRPNRTGATAGFDLRLVGAPSRRPRGSLGDGWGFAAGRPPPGPHVAHDLGCGALHASDGAGPRGPASRRGPSSASAPSASFSSSRCPKRCSG